LADAAHEAIRPQPVDFRARFPNVGAKEAAMLDRTTPKGRILVAALEQATARSWAEVTLLDIAEAAGVPLTELRDLFSSKTAIIAGLLRTVDDEVLKRVPKRGEGQEARDRLFDVVMTRFDVLAPHRAALKSIYHSGSADFALAGPFLSSQHWMLEAAGVATDGSAGALRVAGLGLTYASVFRVWLEDDDPGLARTMAALDRRLRRGERALGTLERLQTAATRFSDAMREGVRAARQRPPGPQAGTSSDPGTV
jgi:AcrR family transcriptional regulator